MEFSYKPAFRLFYYFAEHVKDGSLIEMSIGPNGNHDIWGLKLDGEELMSPEQALDVQRKDGLWGLALFVGFFTSAGWLIRLALKVRRREV